MRGGHNRLPIEIRALRGTVRKDRAQTGDLGQVVLKARCPSWLSPDAKKVWRYLAPRLTAAGVLRETDLPALALMCAHFGVALEAAKALGRDGLLIPDSAHGGALRKHPAAQLLRDASASFQGYAGTFGLTPLDRARLARPEPEPKDGLAEFLAARPVIRPMEEEGDDDGAD